jgi:hypothetical protein
MSSIKNELEDEKDNDSFAGKKTDKDSQDDFDESYLPHNYQPQSFNTHLQQLIIQYSTSFFFYHASKPSKGYFDIIAPPPRV